MLLSQWSGALGPGRRQLCALAYQRWSSSTARKPVAEWNRRVEVSREKGHWDVKENRVAFAKELAERLGTREPEDWKAVSTQDLADLGALGLLKKYKGSVAGMLREAFGEEYVPHRCRSRVPAGYWKERANCRRFFEDMARRYGVLDADDWERITTVDVIREGGTSLLTKHGSVFGALRHAFPEKKTFARPPKERSVKPIGYWNSRDNRLKSLHEVVTSLGIRADQRDGWQAVTRRDIVQHGGGMLMKLYNNSPFAMISDLVPETEMRGTDIGKRVPRRYWDSAENRRQFMLDVAEKFSVVSQEDWKKVRWRDLTHMGATSFLNRYDSVTDALADTFPEGWHGEQWTSLKCRDKVPNNYWANNDNVLAFVKHVEEALSLKGPEEWYRVSLAQLRTLGGGTLLEKKKLVDVLRLAYPEIAWDGERLTSRVKKATQLQCLRMVEEVFPGCTVLEDERHSSLSPEVRGAPTSLELDIFVPQYSFALEYNGIHHYKDLAVFGPWEVYRKRDEEKAELCKSAGIRLLTIPAWWDGSLEAIVASIHEKFPALLHQAVSDLTHSERAKKAIEEVLAGKHEPVPSSPPPCASMDRRAESILGAEATYAQDPEGAFMTDLVKGLPSRWSDESLSTVSTGRRVQAPSEWKEQLPGTEVDGKLVFG